jgi:hypothetical protein
VGDGRDLVTVEERRIDLLPSALRIDACPAAEHTAAFSTRANSSTVAVPLTDQRLL